MLGEDTQATPNDGNGTLPTLLFPGVTSQQLVIFTHVTIYFEGLGVTFYDLGGLVTAGNGMALILMAVLTPAFFRRLDSNEEKAERSSWTSRVLRHYPERTCA